ncbi:hypothetical protein FOZ63_033764 [Perkinsus olseni]|uniref:Uncharacterized protein n=1 Tax=Perkinsus olseni TaxID=32597 RepID=A0A7J6QZ41_PEROL|nr:hypothetical protein FOZ63_033764 [Perkinsus olseni]
MSTKQVIVATAVAVVMASNPPATGAQAPVDDFPELTAANTTWCRFTNKDHSSARKALMVSVDADFYDRRLWTDYVTCPKTKGYKTFSLEFAGGGLYAYYKHGHPLWKDTHKKDAQYTIYGDDESEEAANKKWYSKFWRRQPEGPLEDRSYLHDPVGHSVYKVTSRAPEPAASDDPQEFCSNAKESLKKRFGTFAEMCKEFYGVLKRALKPRKPRGYDYIG